MTTQPPRIVLNMDFSVRKENDAGEADEFHQIRSPYVDAIANAGGAPILVPVLDRTDLFIQYLKIADGVVLIGGDDYPAESYGQQPHAELELCHPRRSAFDLEFARRALATDLPVLAICGGLQLVVIARGGELIQHLPKTALHKQSLDQTPLAHEIRVQHDSRLANILGADRHDVNSSHHQAVEPRNPGEGLKVAAWSEDGVVEAVEGDGERFLLGVQWHPERPNRAQADSAIFSAFLDAARACRARE